jgi:hypothetical protein
VAAGLAVAVFGVLFAIRGTGKASDGPTSTDTPVATTTPPAPDKPAEPPADKPPDTPADKPVATTTPPPQTPPPAQTPDAAPAVAATTPTDSGSTLATLTFVVTPREAVAKADITVDKKPVLGDRFQVSKGDTPVKVVVRSPGYVPFEKEIVPAGDQSVTIELKKVEAATTTPKEPVAKTPAVTKPPPSKPPTRPRPPKKPKVEL